MVLIGYSNGVIMINLREVEEIKCFVMCELMNECYWMLIGYFCYELGYYYWDVLIKGS